MKKLKVLLIAMGMMVTFGTLAAAAVVDVVQAPTDYFVPTDTQKYDWPYYRWNGDDWGWTHNAISGTINSATLNISSFDVDSNATYVPPQVDKIYAFDDGVKTYLGTLVGSTDVWSYTTFSLGSNFFNDINNGLNVFMEIDTTNTGWAVTLAKSALSVDGGTLPPPNPTVPVPPSVWLLGSGLVGVVGLRRRFKIFSK